jgi:hypothetical protein
MAGWRNHTGRAVMTNNRWTLEVVALYHVWNCASIEKKGYPNMCIGKNA